MSLFLDGSNEWGEHSLEENDTQPSPVESSNAATHKPPSHPSHQRLVFADPAAFRYLEEDPSTTVLARRHRLPGYELYLVEQWACSRVHPTFVITTYTGLEQHSVLVSVLSVPTDEDAWSPRLRVYLNAITKFHARKKETHLGTLMVTNLSGFPSALTVVAVPDGDIREHRADFIVNENLKRMGCSGRAGLKLSPPIGATQATFMRFYKTSERLSVYSAVIELVKLCQVALILFGKLAPEYADGLLCDVTERAINDWWTEIGTEFFNVDPTDGILGPTTVAALLGLLLGARNRLHALGAPVGKDVFDLQNTKRGIASFQKSQKMVMKERTRRFDRQTLRRLHKASAKAASGQGWTVPRAVKSTVAELSGKGGDVVMGMVGGRDKIGIAEVETLDIDTFIQLVYGERCKWLWHGKAPKNIETNLFSNAGFDDRMIFSNDEHGGYTWSTTRRDSVLDDYPRRRVADRDHHLSSHESQTNLDLANKELAPRRTVLKSVTGKMTDARSGLERIKEAVGKTGLRGHYHKYSKDGNTASDGDSIIETPVDRFALKQSDLWGPRQETKPNDEEAPGDPRNSFRDSSILDRSSDSKKDVQDIAPDERTPETDAESISSLDSESRNLRLEDHRLNRFHPPHKVSGTSETSLDSLQAANPQDASNLPSRKSEWRKHFPIESDSSPLLRSVKSLSHLRTRFENSYYHDRWPRHLSFSAVVDVLAAGNDPDTHPIISLDAGKNPYATLAFEESLATNARFLGAQLQNLRSNDGSWVEQKVEEVDDFNTQYTKDEENLHHVYRQKREEFDPLREASVELVADQKKGLTEMVKDVDNLGAKLEYELKALQSKVEDVENGVAEFERQVLEIERRAEDLHEAGTKKDSWLWWALGFFAGTSKPFN